MGIPPWTGLPRRPAWTEESIAIVVAVGVVASVGAGWFLLAVVLPRSCPGCPGLTPLGSVLAISSGTPVCVAAMNGSPPACRYVFALAVPEGSNPPLPANVLSFELQDATDNGENQHFSVIALTDASGCLVGLWNSSLGGWTPAPGQCRTLTVADPIRDGDSLVLWPIPSTSPSLSHLGYHLIAVSDRGGFGGQGGAPIF
jgi:hypothetical protein